MLSIGAALVIGGKATDLLSYWPAILVVVGVLVVGYALLRPGAAEKDE